MKQNSLEIGDLYLAVFIKAKYGYEMTDVKKDDGRCVFIFDVKDHNCHELIGSFYNGDDNVSANMFVREMKDLKAMVHNL